MAARTDLQAEQWMFQKYGLTLKGFLMLWKHAEGKCEICGVGLHSRFVKGSKKAGTKRSNVDHCHETGEVRGLLCYGCNTALGKLRDDVERMRNAITYLQRPKTGIKNPENLTLQQLKVQRRAREAPFGLDKEGRPLKKLPQRAGESKAELARRRALASGKSEAEAERLYVEKVNSDYSSWRIHVKRQGLDPYKEKRTRIELPNQD